MWLAGVSDSPHLSWPVVKFEGNEDVIRILMFVSRRTWFISAKMQKKVVMDKTDHAIQIDLAVDLYELVNFMFGVVLVTSKEIEADQRRPFMDEWYGERAAT